MKPSKENAAPDRESARGEVECRQGNDGAKHTPYDGINVKEAERFLCILAPERKQFRLRTFDDSADRGTRSLARKFDGTLDQHAGSLCVLNAKGAGIFVVVNRGGHRAAEITRVRAVFADTDGAPLDPIMRCGLEPHMVVETSPGRWHAYWLVDDLPLDKFAQVQASIADAFGTDPSITDLSRVMRLPGFMHRKGDPFLVRIIHESGGLPYSAEKILARFPPITSGTKQVPVTHAVNGEAVVIQKARHEEALTYTMRVCAEAARNGEAKETAWTRVLAEHTRGRWTRMSDDELLRMFEGAWAKMHAPAENAPASAAPIPAPAVTIDAAALLYEVMAYTGRFVAYPSPHAHLAHVLWIAHAHCMDAWDSTPRIAFLSPEPGSGKSRALEVTEPLVPRPVEAVNVTVAYLFRKVGAQEGRPTILYDEIDTVFGPKAKENEEIRGLLNAGHRRNAVAGRCVVRGKEIFTEEIPAYSAVAFAGLGGLPDTILSRCVVVPMRRRAPDEVVEPYRRRVNGPQGELLRDRLAAWAASIEPHLRDVWPTMPEGIHDRDADVWEALVGMADAAGGDWPDRARVAAVALVTESKATTPSLGVRLLTDLHTVFTEGAVDVLSTETILQKLVDMEEAPWADLRGRPLDSRGLSRRLKPYSVTPRTVRIGSSTSKGYRREDLHDAWSRYVWASQRGNVTSVTSDTPEAPQAAFVPGVTDVTDSIGATQSLCPRCDGEGCEFCEVRK